MEVNPLDPKLIPKYTQELVIPPSFLPTICTSPVSGAVSYNYTVTMNQFEQQILPPEFNPTTVWGYGGTIKDTSTGEEVKFQNAPGPTFEAVRDIPINVKWVNEITAPYSLAVDPTIHWANPNNTPMTPPPGGWPPFPPGVPEDQKDVPLVTHLHGGEQASMFDGNPEAWWTAKGLKGPKYITDTFHYPNVQESTTLWYHDHALGVTRLNVVMGLAGFYILRDPANPLDYPGPLITSAKYEVPIAIQDRSFNEDGSLNFPSEGDNPTIHPYWQPEFFGDTIMVNGRVWPNLNVDMTKYRFRLLNGSNARFYNLKFSNGMQFWQIGTDGGYLNKPVPLTSLLISPGERADILVDFTEIPAGTKIILNNDANAPYPTGDAPDKDTTGQIMQFTVQDNMTMPPELPEKLRCEPVPKLQSPCKKRILTLYEIAGPNGPQMVTLNGQTWSAPVSELPVVGSTEEWDIVNLTMDAHPIHLHLVQFKIACRQAFDVNAYTEDWLDLNSDIGLPPWMTTPKALCPGSYTIGDNQPPAANEAGWKDTIQAPPGEITRIRVRFAPQNVECSCPGENLYPFDPSKGPGYVWHCHILDHEDNDMMRPYRVLP
ncbi:copper oxidase [Clostridium botulinum B2 128]|uniref:multicopper oxidase family protein n=1 Tax=Clostridium botulinum TaxID=1491 RepID=UPI0007DFEEEA|nr:multicopper oxidase [Clostridium botulinum]KEI75088.1 copper oxidase [Clostridium botulinum B2 128]KEI88808.1 copper oxidase [Clostridium botulinum B2 433]NFI41883.1 copper oxidase [Clostridium botulinum]NFI77543.1 copper oxidase [Clostridium botulinum]NFI83732.1 copper oxidase [Clostridium botulinum]